MDSLYWGTVRLVDEIFLETPDREEYLTYLSKEFEVDAA